MAGVLARDQAGGALRSAHVLRRRPAADASSFASLRRAPHRPDPAPSPLFDSCEKPFRVKDVDWPMERSKGGGPRRSRGPGDMSGIGQSTALTRAKTEEL